MYALTHLGSLKLWPLKEESKSRVVIASDLRYEVNMLESKTRSLNTVLYTVLSATQSGLLSYKLSYSI